MPGPTIVGLDVGTSSVKAVAFRSGHAPGPAVRRPIATLIGADGQATQDPRALRDVILGTIADLTERLDPPPRVIAVSTAMHGLVGLDAHGEPVTPLVTWADSRASGIVDGWIADGRAGFLHGRTGVPVHPMAPVAKIAWWDAEAPDVAARVACWSDLKALVMRWLTGEVVTDLSSASGWGLLDVRRHVWDDEALGLAGASPTQLPATVLPTTRFTVTSDVARATGLSVDAEVVIGAADGPSGNVGVGATGPGVAAVSLGTSGAVRVVVDAVADLDPGLFCYVLDDERWVVGGAVSNGGNIVDWLARSLRIGAEVASGDAAAEVLALAAVAPPGSDGLVMVPYLLAERAPLWNAGLAGAYLGLRAGHGPEHLARAAVEGVCAGLGVVTDLLDVAAGVTSVRATGGALDHELWRTVLAAALDRPTTVVSSTAGSATGAAAFGLVAIGAAPDTDTARRAIVGTQQIDRSAVRVPPAVAAAATRTRRTITGSVRVLDDVADAFAPRRDRR